MKSRAWQGAAATPERTVTQSRGYEEHDAQQHKERDMLNKIYVPHATKRTRYARRTTQPRSQAGLPGASFCAADRVEHTDSVKDTCTMHQTRHGQKQQQHQDLQECREKPFCSSRASPWPPPCRPTTKGRTQRSRGDQRPTPPTLRRAPPPPRRLPRRQRSRCGSEAARSGGAASSTRAACQPRLRARPAWSRHVCDPSPAGIIRRPTLGSVPCAP